MNRKNNNRRKHFKGFSLLNLIFISVIADGLAVLWIFGIF
jgi:hypothetical protein